MNQTESTTYDHQGGIIPLKRDEFVLKRRPKDLHWQSSPATGRVSEKTGKILDRGRAI